MSAQTCDHDEALKIAHVVDVLATAGHRVDANLQKVSRALLAAAKAREALASFGFGSIRDDERIGWRGRTAASADIYQCEFCNREHQDSTLIEHADDCPVLAARDALSPRAGA